MADTTSPARAGSPDGPRSPGGAGTASSPVAREATVHRVESLPGAGRWAVTFRRPDGSEQTAVVHVVGDDGQVEVAEASLPVGWSRQDEAFTAVADALVALGRSRSASEPTGRTLRDVDGGWDVSLGNIVLDDAGAPACIAHGPLVGSARGAGTGGEWTCEVCGARALVA